MPAYKLPGNAYAVAGTDDEDETDMEYVEVDPTQRYGRYNEVLGQGACKTVYRAFDKLHGIEVAWNQVKDVQDAMRSSKELERLHSEVYLLKTLKHKNILKFYDSWVDTKTKTVNFITEMLTSGNLRQYRKKHKRVDLKAVKSWARQILRGLLYLHSHDPPIIHRDIKCDNIFINGNDGEVKIGDLGLAVVLQQAHAAHSVIGTPEFMAPELYEEEYTELVDIYSFGMCLLELITLEYPYSECGNAAQIYRKVTSGKKPACLDKVKDAEVRSFVEKCLADASCRLPARELLMDPFLQGPGNMETSVGLPHCHLQTCTNETMKLDTMSAEPTRAVDSQVKKRNKAQLSHSSQIKDFLHSHQVPVSLVCDSQKMDVDVHQQIEKVSLSNLTKLSPENNQDLSLRSIKADGIISFIFRIGDKKGHFRSIRFPFNPEADTALSVASEMITALGLTDRDATAIAEKIDSELTTLIPHWKPGAAFDETVVNDEKSSSDELFDADGCTVPSKDDVRVEAINSSEGPVLGLLSSSHGPSCSSTVTSSNDTISCDFPDFPTICGHLEESCCATSDNSCQSDECLSFQSSNQEAQDVLKIKDLSSELIFSISLNPAIVEEENVINCGCANSSNLEAAVAFKSGWVDASKQTSPKMNLEENTSSSDIKCMRKSPDKEELMQKMHCLLKIKGVTRLSFQH
ncbi:hypothetical protein O6H91_13G082400 [Diphasiastrum complanatum]|uniref:Uncharacterized protein n=10 Tax=Diphasiastrum complanatum TaxID=34168 RepID=A0ACC2BXL8_DIPCM|nr:hypothetical protein O6H91_13G082400 [Diphasiastrum complanatum]KAJ7534161.1 hypothetical protein O6H91_13G082400 [Diphasiastrum complanatum]KAJ7534163.1 hypothetical protein O6H91_13G082400 [Diphasiastrum complanatum]KAJ7534164.1 hypothetical protein O6H91_13G082400 [Diphasiastrum complanatum]KAJ7534165.1 hypothetical protein O6H91_13G082400 [Diphasiastrum complanatum]